MIDNMGDRMKLYESIEAKRVLVPRLPIIIRADGRAFHTFTRGMKYPIDSDLHNAMVQTMKALVDETDACIGYVQSDEISLVLSDEKEPMFGGRPMKIASVVASLATAVFNREIHKAYPDKPLATFDCRVWNVPNRDEAANALLWREFDCTKNSISMAARSVVSDARLMGLNSSEKQDVLMEHGINWNDYPVFFKRGTYARRVAFERKLTQEELDKLPPRHNARNNPDLLVTRSEVTEVDMPVFSKVTNRVGVIFNGETPVVENDN